MLPPYLNHPFFICFLVSQVENTLLIKLINTPNLSVEMPKIKKGISEKTLTKIIIINQKKNIFICLICTIESVN
jgi:hypothetical protein